MSDEYPDWQDEKVKLVRNHEAIVSIWPADRENALGWFDVGVEGTKGECLAWVEEECDGNCRMKNPPSDAQTPPWMLNAVKDLGLDSSVAPPAPELDAR